MGWHFVVRAHDLDGRPREASGMSKAAKSARTDAPPRRDYDRRKRKGAIRRSSGRPIWRRPLLLGLAVMLLGTGGAGGWWAWKEGWLVEAQNRLDDVSRGVIAGMT